MAGLEVVHLPDEVLLRQADDARVLGAALAVRVMAQRARPDAGGFAPVRDDRRHGRMVARIPIGGPHAVTDLVERELARAARQRIFRAIVGGRWWRWAHRDG